MDITVIFIFNWLFREFDRKVWERDVIRLLVYF